MPDMASTIDAYAGQLPYGEPLLPKPDTDTYTTPACTAFTAS